MLLSLLTSGETQQVAQLPGMRKKGRAEPDPGPRLGSQPGLSSPVNRSQGETQYILHFH
jgi:hypothetical protein